MDFAAFLADDEIVEDEVEQQHADANRLRADQERTRRERQNAALDLLKEKVETLIPSGGKRRSQVEVFKLAAGLLDQMIQNARAMKILNNCEDCRLRFSVVNTLAAGYQQNQNQAGHQLGNLAEAASEEEAASEGTEAGNVHITESQQQSFISDSDTSTASEDGSSPIDTEPIDVPFQQQQHM